MEKAKGAMGDSSNKYQKEVRSNDMTALNKPKTSNRHGPNQRKLVNS